MSAVHVCYVCLGYSSAVKSCVGYSGVGMREQVGDYCCTRDHTLVSSATLGNACGCMCMYMVVCV